MNGASVQASAAEDAPACWICLDGPTSSKPLLTPCKCISRPVHRACLARWQLHSAGKSEEHKCRFCDSELPDWRPSILGDNEEQGNAPKPLMAKLVFNNQIHVIPILPGPEGKAAFKKQVNELFGLGLNSRYEVTFECKLQADNVRLSGLHAYEAATRCAALSSNRGAAATAEAAAADAGASNSGALAAV